MLGDRIKEYRIKANFSQAELADRLEVKQGTISSWEVGRTEPNMGYIEALSKVLGCSKSDLIGDNNYVPEEKPDFVYMDNSFSEEEKLIIEAYKGASSVNRIKALAILLGKEL